MLTLRRAETKNRAALKVWTIFGSELAGCAEGQVNQCTERQTVCKVLLLLEGFERVRETAVKTRPPISPVTYTLQRAQPPNISIHHWTQHIPEQTGGHNRVQRRPKRSWVLPSSGQAPHEDNIVILISGQFSKLFTVNKLQSKAPSLGGMLNREKDRWFGFRNKKLLDQFIHFGLHLFTYRAALHHWVTSTGEAVQFAAPCLYVSCPSQSVPAPIRLTATWQRGLPLSIFSSDAAPRAQAPSNSLSPSPREPAWLIKGKQTLRFPPALCKTLLIKE
ncbi:hypothetical protein NQZ68_012275 [Dissostichus eleginoides]|nr:hypothetical protein NQZ68_012275 [Dissostichus eleginoides]